MPRAELDTAQLELAIHTYEGNRNKTKHAAVEVFHRRFDSMGESTLFTRLLNARNGNYA